MPKKCLELIIFLNVYGKCKLLLLTFNILVNVYFKGFILIHSLYHFRLNWLLFGSVFSFHLTNVALHSACVVLLLYFCRELLAWRRDAALIAALMFAAHPVHTEAVSKHIILFSFNIIFLSEYLCIFMHG